MSAYVQIIPPHLLKELLSHSKEKAEFERRNLNHIDRKFCSLMLLWGTVADMFLEREPELAREIHDTISEAETASDRDDLRLLEYDLRMIHEACEYLKARMTPEDKARHAFNQVVVVWITGARS